MSRIRSIHPGFATDENMVTVSRDARLFFLLLLTECDDQGAFEWKPVTLKMKLLPADTIDISALLSELSGINAIRAYEMDGRKFGAVRNFRKFQRPKSPNALHPISDDIRKYVALSPVTSEMEPDKPPPVPRKGEKSPQMEDGGGRGTSDPNGSGAKAAPSVDPVKALFDVGVKILTADGKSDGEARSLVGKWRKKLGDEELATLITEAARKTRAVEWLSKAVAQSAERKAKPYGEAML